MIRHIVLFRLKPGYGWDDPEVRAAEELQRRLGSEIPELRSVTCGRDVSRRPIAYDYALIGLFDDEDALARYLAHPFHQKVAAAWERISERVIADLREEDEAAPADDDDEVSEVSEGDTGDKGGDARVHAD